MKLENNNKYMVKQIGKKSKCLILIDWLVFSANFSNISAISWPEQISLSNY